MNKVQSGTELEVDGDLRAPSGSRHRSDGARRSPSTFEFRHWLHESLTDISTDSSILALGCEEAFLAPQLLEYAANVTVLDTSGGQMAQLARRFPEISFLQHHPAKPLPFPAEAFDVVCCCELLDRVFDPQAVLRELHRVLVPGGRVLISVPDHGGMRKMLRALFSHRERGASANPRVHHFTRRTLGNIVRDAGFKAIQIATNAATGKGQGQDESRRLVLKARRGPEVRCDSAERAARPVAAAWTFAEELAFAGRVRAA